MARGRPRPFLDTNVIVSGLYTPNGHAAAILDQHVQGRLVIVISRQVLEELSKTLTTKRPDLIPML